MALSTGPIPAILPFVDESCAGPSAGSTPEYKALSKFQDALAHSQGVKMYMDIHSYSQLWMTRKPPPPPLLQLC